jgi:hypothetical protein
MRKVNDKLLFDCLGSSELSLFERIDSWMSGSSVDMETDQQHTQSLDSSISMAAVSNGHWM